MLIIVQGRAGGGTSAYLSASRTAWYMFSLRVSRPTISCAGSASTWSTHLSPGVRRDTSRVGFRKAEVAIEGRWPPAGGGFACVLDHRRLTRYTTMSSVVLPNAFCKQNSYFQPWNNPQRARHVVRGREVVVVESQDGTGPKIRSVI